MGFIRTRTNNFFLYRPTMQIIGVGLRMLTLKDLARLKKPYRPYTFLFNFFHLAGLKLPFPSGNEGGAVFVFNPRVVIFHSKNSLVKEIL